MKVSTTGLLLSTAFFLSIMIQERVFADSEFLQEAQPHEEFHECGTWCENTCANPRAEMGACISMCKRGYFCHSGYIRQYQDGPCILPSDCPRKQRTETPREIHTEEK